MAVPADVKRENVAEAPGRADQRVTLVYATFPNIDIADRIGGELVLAGLAACVNIIPGIRSIYRWEGAIQLDAEVAAIIKTRVSLTPRVIGWLRISHPYVTPATLALPVVDGSAAFLDWIRSETHG